METYRLSSKLKENDTEYVIQTTHDTDRQSINTSVYVNGSLTEIEKHPHPEDLNADRVASLVDDSHDEKKRELESLLTTYRRVAESGNPELMYQLGIAFYYKKLYSDAACLFRGALALAPEYHQASNYLGMTELKQGNTVLSINAARTAVEARPEYADYHHNLGEAYLANNACAEAIAEFEAAIKINLYYSDAYYSLGLAHLLDAALSRDDRHWPARLAKIKECLNKAALIYQDFRCPAFESGFASLDGGEIQQALDTFKSVLESRRERNLKKTTAFYIKLALFPDMVSEKLIGDRIAFLETEIKNKPSYFDLHADLSLCYLEQARMFWQKGMEQYQKTYKLNPSLKRVRFAMEEAEKMNEEIAVTIKRITGQG